MTIFDYNNLPLISVPYILRDEDNQMVGVYVTNQETKQEIYCQVADPARVFVYEAYFDIDVTAIEREINENTTLSVKAVDSTGLPIYRDIVVFSQRLDAVSDYEQNSEDNQYIFVDS